MAYTKTPDNSTYTTVEVDLVKVNQSRGSTTSKDPILINCYPEYNINKLTKEQEVTVVRRSGYVALTSGSGTTVRGMFYWKDQDRILLAVDDDIYVYNGASGALVTTLNAVWATSSGEVGFTEFLYDNGTTKIVAVDGARVVTIDSAWTVVTGADGDQPSAFIPIPIFLNGYLLLIKDSTADIYNSDNNDPLAYTAGAFINAEIEPDQLRSIVKLNNYIAVLGTNSIEYFYDAGIGTGSPLQRNEVPVKQVGYVGGLALHNNTAYFIGAERRGKPSVFVLEDLKIKEVGHLGTRRYLEAYPYTFTTVLHGTIVSDNGHTFYVLSDSLRADVLDIESGIWTQWVKGAGSAFELKYALSYASLTVTRSLLVFAGSPNIYYMSPTSTQDDNVSFTMTIVTAPEDFGTLNWKNMSRLIVWADYPTSTQTITIQWTDDDYQTYNTAQNIDLYQDLPSICQLGGFRQRAFKITYTGSEDLRIQKLECEINKGNN